MSPFLTALFVLLGPLLIDLLKNLFKKDAAAAEKALGDKLKGLSDGAKSGLVIDHILSKTPRRKVRYRNFLRAARVEAPPVLEAGKTKFPKAVAAELTVLGNDGGDE